MKYSYEGIRINCAKNTHEVVFGLISKDRGATVADVPSGAGAFVKRLVDAGYSNTFAIDIDNLLAFEHESFVQGDMTERLPFEDRSIDTLVCIDGIEHIHRQDDFVREVARVLKPAGEVIVTTPNISSLRSRWRWLMTGHHYKCNAPLDEDNPNPLHHVAMISFPELRYLFHTNGIRVRDIATNRIKPAAWLYAPLVPISYLFTRLAYGKEAKKQGTSRINHEVQRAMFSLPVLFGETLVLRGEKCGSSED